MRLTYCITVDAGTTNTKMIDQLMNEHLNTCAIQIVETLIAEDIAVSVEIEKGEGAPPCPSPAHTP